MIKAVYNNNTLAVLNTSDILQDGKEYFLEIKKDKRTNQQFNLFWLWMETIGNETGHTKNQMKKVLFKKFGFYTTFTNKLTGEIEEEIESIANDIPKKRLNEIMFEVQLFADEWGYELPNPENLKFKNDN